MCPWGKRKWELEGPQPSRQLHSQMDDYKSNSDLPRGMLSRRSQGCQGGGEYEQQPGQACLFHRCSDVLLSFKGQIIPGGHQPHYITNSSDSSCS